MKIKKHGKFVKEEKPNTEKFSCDNCGCEFTALEDEFYVDLAGAESWSCSSLTYTISSSTTKDYLVCSCPECHKIVKKIRERNTPISYTYANSTSGTSVKSDKDYVTISCNADDLKTVNL